MPRRPGFFGTYAALIAAVLGSALVSLGRVEAPPVGPASVAQPPVVRQAAAEKSRPAATDMAKASAPAAAAPKGLVASVENDGAPQLVRGSKGSSKAAPSSPQQRAAQVPGQPATFYWALIIGINDYAPPTRDNVGSYQDAMALRAHLLSLGWRDDHIMMITNRKATRAGILAGLSWLRAKTTSESTAVFHYSGHEKPFSRDVDGDGEARDVALWAADNRLIVDGDLGDALGAVRARHMWINLAVCRAGGFDDPGMSKPGRVITYSSPESELSYEDPSIGHSVFGYHSIVQGMRNRQADADADGVVSVEEAFAYAKPLVTDHTSGRQHPTMSDRFSGGFTLTPPAPEPAPPSGGGSGGSGGSPRPSPTPTPCTLPVGCPGTRQD